MAPQTEAASTATECFMGRSAFTGTALLPRFVDAPHFYQSTHRFVSRRGLNQMPFRFSTTRSRTRPTRPGSPLELQYFPFWRFSLIVGHTQNRSEERRVGKECRS